MEFHATETLKKKLNKTAGKESAERDNYENPKPPNNRERQMLGELMMDPGRNASEEIGPERRDECASSWLGSVSRSRYRSRTTEAAGQQRLGFYCSVRLPVGSLVKQTQREEFVVPGTQ